MTQNSNLRIHVVKPALCLDLDGTIRYSKRGPFIHKPEDIVLFDGTEDVIWGFRDKGYLILGVTNQGGVAYGLKKPGDVDDEIEATLRLFERNPFDVIKASLLHPEGRVEPYKHRSLLRKPDIGMLALYEAEFFAKGVVIDWDNSIFVGDRPEDEECAGRAGIEFIWAHEFFNRDPI
jgi:D-glycero-D-manno-heptose 1,7-bisphosphate phosphatase